MDSDGRRGGGRGIALGFLLAVGLGALLLHLVGGRGTGPEGVGTPDDALRARGGGPTPQAAFVGSGAPVLSAPPARPDPASPEVASGDASAPAPAAPSTPTFAGAAAVVRVALRLPDAWRALDGQAYALPAGQPDGSDHPAVTVPANATVALLPLPQAGRWDVGYAGRYGQVLVPDVLAEGTVEVVVDARSAAPVRFRARGAAGPTARGRVTLSAPDGVDHPGRGQCSPVSVFVEIDGPGDVLTPPLAAGVEYRVAGGSGSSLRAPGGAPGFEWIPSRETARAGDDVDLILTPLGLVRVTLESSAPPPGDWVQEWKSDPWIAAGAQGEAEAEPSHFASTNLRRDGTFTNDVLLLPLAPGRYTLRMYPEGSVFQGMTRSIEVRASEVLDVRASAAFDLARNPFRPAGAVPDLATQVALEVGAPPRRGWALAAQTWDGHAHYWAEMGNNQGGALEVASTDPVHRGLLVLPPDRASDVFDVPARGAVPVPLKPAGMIVLVPDVVPDPALGPLRLRRADGLPLPLYAGGDTRGEVQFEEEPEVKMGTVVGPLVEGRLSLEVRLGGVVIARPVAEVRAGKNTPLSIPIPAGLPR